LDAKRVCRIPRDALARQDAVTLNFLASGADAPETLSFKPTIESPPRPIFAYSHHVVDNREQANRNGQLEKGEGATLYLHVKNVGQGPAYESQANLRNLTGDGVLLKAGRFDVSGLAPGETRDVAFTFDLLKSLKADELTLEVSVADRDLGAFTSEKLDLPIFGASTTRKITGGLATRKANAKASIYEQPDQDSGTVGRLAPGSTVTVLGKVGRFFQVALSPERFGFVAQEDLAEASGNAPAEAKWSPELSHSAPLLTVKAKALSTRGDSMRIDVVAKDESDGVMDAFVFVGNRKVFYKPNPKKDGKEMRFSLDAKLNPGINVITVVARESQDVAARHRVVVRKDGPNGEILPTPKNEMFGEDWEFGDSE
jgi:carboxyl-terminal processing protease